MQIDKIYYDRLEYREALEKQLGLKKVIEHEGLVYFKLEDLSKLAGYQKKDLRKSKSLQKFISKLPMARPGESRNLDLIQLLQDGGLQFHATIKESRASQMEYNLAELAQKAKKQEAALEGMANKENLPPATSTPLASKDICMTSNISKNRPKLLLIKGPSILLLRIDEIGQNRRYYDITVL